MKPRNRQRRSLNVSNSRWMAYAVAGLATAAGGAISVEGAIHYSGPIDFKFHQQYGFHHHTFPLSQGVFVEGFRIARGLGGDSSATFAIGGAAVSNALRLYPPFFSSVAEPLS